MSWKYQVSTTTDWKYVAATTDDWKYVVTSDEYCDEYQAVYDAMTTAPSATIAEAQDILVRELISGGIWDKLDLFYLFATSVNTGGEALINWVNPGTFDATAVNGPTFTTLQGFTGIYSNNTYINTSYSPNSDKINMALNDASIGVYCRLNLNNTGAAEMGSGSTSNAINLWSRFSNTAYLRLNQTTISSAANTDSRGMFVGTRDASNNVDLYLNGDVLISGTTASTSIPTNELYILATSIGVDTPNFISNNEIACAFVGSSLTSAQISDLTDAIDKYMWNNSKSTITRNIICDGNSLTYGQGVPGGEYPTLLAAENTFFSVTNKGVNGQTTVQMSADAATDIDPLIVSGEDNILIAWEVTNEMYYGASNQDCYDHFATYCQNRQAAGWKVIALGTIPRGTTEDDGTSVEQYNADLTAVNALMSANYTDFADAYVELVSDERLADYNDTTYYQSDKTHLKQAGYQVVADMVAEAINGLIGS